MKPNVDTIYGNRPREPEAKRPGPTEDEIRQRAYEIFLRRGGAPGNAILDWFQAECELGTSRFATSRNQEAD